VTRQRQRIRPTLAQRRPESRFGACAAVPWLRYRRVKMRCFRTDTSYSMNCRSYGEAIRRGVEAELTHEVATGVKHVGSSATSERKYRIPVGRKNPFKRCKLAWPASSAPSGPLVFPSAVKCPQLKVHCVRDDNKAIRYFTVAPGTVRPFSHRQTVDTSTPTRWANSRRVRPRALRSARYFSPGVAPSENGT
jgi:hypothetical protein